MALKQDNPGCDCCDESTADCWYCTGDTPDPVTVEISGVANDTCADCTDLNGTYVLDWIGDDRYCKWQVELTTAICGYNYLTLGIEGTTIVGDDIWVSFSSDIWPSHSSNDSWHKGSVDSGDFDCMTWSGWTFPSYNEDQCDLSSSACKLTA